MTAVPAWVDRQEYPFASRFADLPAGRIHYVDEGAGDPILFVHGTPTWSFEFRHLIRALRGGHRCIAPDLLGFGLSARPRAFEYSPEAHANVVADFVDAVKLDRFSLVVHDFGGPIALPLALAGRVNRLVLMNTWMWPIDDPRIRRRARLAAGRVGRWLYGYANASLRGLMPYAYANRAALTPSIHEQYLAPFQEPRDRMLVLHALARALTGSSGYYAELWRRAAALTRVPALLVWGMQDPAFGPAFLERWQALLPAASVVRVAAGHWPHEEQPAIVAKAVEGFLGRA